MLRVNLLPPELVIRHAERRRARRFVAAGLVALLLVAGADLAMRARRSSVEPLLADQLAENARLEARAQVLTPFSKLQREVATRRDIVREVQARRVDWSRLFREVSLAIPRGAWLTSIRGSLRDGAAPGDDLGTVSFTGYGARAATVSDWLSNLTRIHGLTDAWSSGAEPARVGDASVVRFSSRATLSAEAALTGRLP